MRYFYGASAAFIICGKALEPAYLNRFFNTMKSLANRAWRLTLRLLGANAPTYRRKQIGSLYYSGGAKEISFLDLADKPWNINSHWATRDTWSILTLSDSALLLT